MISYFTGLKHKLKQGMPREMWHEAKWMYRYARKYWKAIIYYIVLGILGTGMGLAGSVASKYLIDAVTGYDTGNIAFIAGIILSMALGNIIIGAVTNRISARITLKVNNEIQADVYRKIMDTDWEAVSGFHSGDLLNRLNSDVATVAGSVLGWIPALITRLLQFTGTFAVILYYDPAMAFIALLSAPVTAVMSRLLMRRMRSHNKRLREISSEMTAFHEESFQNIQTIKCFDLIGFFGERLGKIQKKYVDFSMEFNKFSIYTSSFLSLVGITVSYAAFGWGVFRLWSGAITYGTMTLFLQLSGSLSGGFSALAGMIPSAIGAVTCAGRIMAVIGLPRESYKDSENVRLFEQSKPFGLTIRLSHINFHYKDRPEDIILQNEDFTAKQGELVAVIGPSGEGKTTLLKLLLGLLNPTRGEAKLTDGRGLHMKISAATRKFFSYVPQGNSIFSGSIADNLRMVRPEASREELTEVLKAACAYDFVKELPENMDTVIGEKGIGISEGEAQRIAIARAILREAPILLFDEATSALDAETEKNVLQNIMVYGSNKTCIFTTHRQSVASVCDRVYQISGACLKDSVENQDFPHGEFVLPPKFAGLW